MRIALFCDDYLPDGTRVHAKMMHELATHLVHIGHQVVVITPGSPLQASKLLIERFCGVEVWRFRSGYTRGVGMVRRAVNEWLLSYKAWSAIKSMIQTEDFDLCINYSPTIFFGPLAKKFKKRGAYVFLVLRDFFPQWIIDDGLIRKQSLAAHFFRYYEELNYKTSDCIGVQSQANLDVFSIKYPYCNNIKILRNWSDTIPLPAKDHNQEFLSNHNITNKIIFFYGGNTGRAQDMKNIMRLAKNMRKFKIAHFLIIGQGDEFELIKTLKSKWKLENITILPSVSHEEFKGILAVTDIGLFSLAHSHRAHNFPGKLLGYMVESKPILGSVNPGNDLQTLISSKNAGFVFVNGDDDLLADAAARLVKDIKLRKEMGLNSRNLLQDFSIETAAMIILNSVKGS